jgi:acetyl-CoA carboxylase alpha subunit
MDKKEYMKEYYKKNKDKIIEKAKEWKKNNPEKVAEITKKVNKSKKAKIRKSKWIKNNLEKNKKSKEKWQKENKELRTKNQKDYIQRHPEKIKAQQLARQIPLKSSCQICGDIQNLERHHWRYDKPLMVATLCKFCHTIQHNKNIIFAGGIEDRRGQL